MFVLFLYAGQTQKLLCNFRNEDYCSCLNSCCTDARLVQVSASMIRILAEETVTVTFVCFKARTAIHTDNLIRFCKCRCTALVECRVDPTVELIYLVWIIIDSPQRPSPALDVALPVYPCEFRGVHRLFHARNCYQASDGAESSVTKAAPYGNLYIAEKSTSQIRVGEE